MDETRPLAFRPTVFSCFPSFFIHARKRTHETTTDDIRRMFGPFSTDLVDDCDYIDPIANKLTTITDIEAELNITDSFAAALSRAK